MSDRLVGLISNRAGGVLRPELDIIAADRLKRFIADVRRVWFRLIAQNARLAAGCYGPEPRININARFSWKKTPHCAVNNDACRLQHATTSLL